MPNVWLIKIPWEGLPLALCWSVYWPLKNLQVELSPLQMPHASREAWEPRIWSQPTACQRNLQSASFWKAKICPGSYLGSKRATAMLQGLICFLMFTHTSKHTPCLQNVPAVIWICKCVCVHTNTSDSVKIVWTRKLPCPFTPSAISEENAGATLFPWSCICGNLKAASFISAQSQESFSVRLVICVALASRWLRRPCQSITIPICLGCTSGQLLDCDSAHGFYIPLDKVWTCFQTYTHV